MGTEHPHRSPAAGPGYEVRDVNIHFFAAAVLGLFLLTLLGMSVSWWFQGLSARQQQAADQPPSPLAQTLPALPPEPRLQVKPPLDRAKIEAVEEAALDRYEWIDPKSGLVRIPIDRAIDLLAERGLPARPAPPATREAPAQAKE